MNCSLSTVTTVANYCTGRDVINDVAATKAP
jgi:hypothetical protein